MPKHYRQLASEGLTQGSYVAARVGFEPATIRMQGTEPTTEQPHPTITKWTTIYILEE